MNNASLTEIEPEILVNLEKLDVQLEKYVVQRNLKQYLTPKITITPKNSVKFYFYCGDPHDAHNDNNVNQGVIPVDTYSLRSSEFNNGYIQMIDTITDVEKIAASPELSFKLEQINPTFTFAQRQHITSTVAAISSSIILMTDRTNAAEQKKCYVPDTEHFEDKIITLAASNLALTHIMEGLLYIIPTGEEDYAQFIEDVQKLPYQWLDELYETDPELHLSETGLNSLYNLVS